MIDPSVWIAALINPYGTSARVIEPDRSGHPVITQQPVDELATVLVRLKFRHWIDLGDAVASVETLGGKADRLPGSTRHHIP